MATNLTQAPGASPANPSRRSIMAVTAAAAAIAVTRPVFASPAEGGLAAAVTAYRTASAACDAFNDSKHMPGLKAWKKAEMAIPHITTRSTFINIAGERVALSTADAADVASARSLMKRKAFPAADFPEYFETSAELVIAADQREAECARLREAHKIDRLREREEELAAHSHRMMWAAVDLPVANLEELAAKLEFLNEVEIWECPSSIEAINADVRRLIQMGAH